MGWKGGLACCKECWAGCCGGRRRRLSFAFGRLGSCLIGLAVDLRGERGSSSVLSSLAGGLGDTRRGLGLGKIRDFGENMAGVGVVGIGSSVNSTLLVLTFSGNWVVTAAGNEGEAGRTNGTGVGEKRGTDGDPTDVGSFGFPSWKNWKFPRPSWK